MLELEFTTDSSLRISYRLLRPNDVVPKGTPVYEYRTIYTNAPGGSGETTGHLLTSSYDDFLALINKWNGFRDVPSESVMYQYFAVTDRPQPPSPWDESKKRADEAKARRERASFTVYNSKIGPVEAALRKAIVVAIDAGSNEIARALCLLAEQAKQARQ